MRPKVSGYRVVRATQSANLLICLLVSSAADVPALQRRRGSRCSIARVVWLSVRNDGLGARLATTRWVDHCGRR
ncbi:hypothetical protein K469DRAFT_98946 [Zopfia rhizophila CBS 207.26]|uniref:Secreted protein n=1 Tax=Zopfia rhizophila CBS 207.26 TaxID=1314779 RepID=A0A6A6EDN3_9PEZI|nr:hypothetical protein K469DRAFT_98946 [Zopfia rhizophila CBS 207.26]